MGDKREGRGRTGKGQYIPVIDLPPAGEADLLEHGRGGRGRGVEGGGRLWEGARRGLDEVGELY
jgi:hypothetical protein